MTRAFEPDAFKEAATFFKALANENRLHIVSLLRERPHSVQELAAAVSLTEPTVSHHLSVLSGTRLVDMEADGNTHWYRLRKAELQKAGRFILARETQKPPALADEREADRRVRENFFEGERLIQIPAQRKKRLTVLRWLVGKFAFGERYPEVEINRVIKRHHEDTATLRRELIINRMMSRERGIYWREPEENWLKA